MDSSPGNALASAHTALDPPLSKNKLKKLKREEKWEAGREFRKAKRKEKVKLKRQRKKAAALDRGDGNPVNISASNNTLLSFDERSIPGPQRHEQLPITFVLDCGFDEYMDEKELKSLASQLTRSYADNQKATFRAHLIISSFEGRLKERFEGVLGGHFKSWKNVQVLGCDVPAAADAASAWMGSDPRSKLAGAFDKYNDKKDGKDEPLSRGEIIYLTSDSPDTLTELSPSGTYIIGGLVDHNRHKGICYKKALSMGLKTAKLPIGEYMQMNSRFILATNHVVEVMLYWLECGDWGQSFVRALPKRKGGVLKDNGTPVDKDTASEVSPADRNLSVSGSERSDVYDAEKHETNDPTHFPVEELRLQRTE